MSLEGPGALSAPLARPNRRGMTPGSNPYLFVVGAARSGTTLLQRMLDAHPLLAVVNETYWLPRKYRKRTGLTRDGLVTAALFPLLLDSPKFERMGFGEEDLQRIAGDGAPIRYMDFVGRLFDEYATRQGKQLAGDKTPGYVRRMAQLHELWPEARFVHIIRDPRDVCLSLLDWSSGERTAGQFVTWQLDRAVSSALYWRYSVAIGREAGMAPRGRVVPRDAVREPGHHDRSGTRPSVRVPRHPVRRGDAELPRRPDQTQARAQQQGSVASTHPRAARLEHPARRTRQCGD